MSVRDPDGQHACARHRGHLFGEIREPIEKLSEAGLVGASGRCRFQPVGLALEQRQAEAVFQQVHHPADGRGRDVQLVGGLHEAAGAGRRLECLDAVEKGQSAHRYHQEN